MALGNIDANGMGVPTSLLLAVTFPFPHHSLLSSYTAEHPKSYQLLKISWIYVPIFSLLLYFCKITGSKPMKHTLYAYHTMRITKIVFIKRNKTAQLFGNSHPYSSHCTQSLNRICQVASARKPRSNTLLNSSRLTTARSVQPFLHGRICHVLHALYCTGPLLHFLKKLPLNVKMFWSSVLHLTHFLDFLWPSDRPLQTARGSSHCYFTKISLGLYGRYQRTDRQTDKMNSTDKNGLLTLNLWRGLTNTTTKQWIYLM